MGQRRTDGRSTVTWTLLCILCGQCHNAENVVVKGHSRSSAMSLFDRAQSVQPSVCGIANGIGDNCGSSVSDSAHFQLESVHRALILSVQRAGRSMRQRAITQTPADVCRAEPVRSQCRDFIIQPTSMQIPTVAYTVFEKNVHLFSF